MAHKSPESESRWDWKSDKLKPMTKSLLAIYGNGIGDKRWQINRHTFRDILHDGFGAENVAFILRDGGYSPSVMQQQTAFVLREFVDPDEGAKRLKGIAKLAGGTVAQHDLALQIALDIYGDNNRFFETLPSLRVLTELAVSNNVKFPA